MGTVTLDSPAPTARSRRVGGDWGLVFTLMIGLLVGVRIVATAAALPAGERARVQFREFSDDAARYHEIASAKGAPYRDAAIEFPPVAVAYIEMINGPTTGATMGRLGWASLMLDLAAAGGLAYGWGKRAAIAYLVLGLPFFYLPFVYFRVDLLSVALATWGLALVKRRHDIAGGGLLALAVFAKLWPLALIPLLVIERRWRALWTTVAVGTAVAIAWFAWSGIGGFEDVATFRHARGWQIESAVGGIVRLVTGDPIRFESGAIRAGTAPFWATSLLALTMVMTVGFVWREAARAQDEGGLRFGVAPIAAITTCMLCSPLLSSQYLVWLLPFAAIAWAEGRRLLGAMVCSAIGGTMVLTQLYPGLNRNDWAADLVLLARNVLLLAIVVAAVQTLRRAPRLASLSGDVENAAEGVGPFGDRVGAPPETPDAGSLPGRSKTRSTVVEIDR